MNPDSFFSNLARFGDAPALIDRFSGRVIRYSELEASLPKASGGIVATWAKTSLDHVLFLLAVLRQGGVVAPVSFRLPKAEAIDRAHRLGARELHSEFLCRAGVPPAINRFSIAGGTPALLSAGTLLHTSGSSGRGRVVYHDLAAHIASA